MDTPPHPQKVRAQLPRKSPSIKLHRVLKVLEAVLEGITLVLAVFQSQWSIATGFLILLVHIVLLGLKDE